MRLTSPQKRLIKEADEFTRQTERTAFSGDQQAETKLLAQRIRSGELSRKNVAVAAALGYEPAKPLGEIELTAPPVFLLAVRARGPYWKIRSALEASDLSHEEVVNFAADCAEQVLPIYEKEFPNDNRPRMDIEAARSMNAGDAHNYAFIAGDALKVRAAAASAHASVYIATGAPGAAAWAAVDAVNAGLSKDWVINRLIGYLLKKI